MEIQEFRIGQNVQVKVSSKWYKLLSFTNGTYGIKREVKKPFNPYFIFDVRETEKINKFYSN